MRQKPPHPWCGRTMQTKVPKRLHHVNGRWSRYFGVCRGQAGYVQDCTSKRMMSLQPAQSRGLFKVRPHLSPCRLAMPVGMVMGFPV